MPYKDKKKQQAYLKVYKKKYRKNNLSKLLKQSRDWNNDNKDMRKNSSLKLYYGITLEEYNEMFVSQNGVCAICKESQITGKSLSVDHNHETSKVRGLLCNKCNTGIGLLGEKEEILLEAIKYIKNN